MEIAKVTPVFKGGGGDIADLSNYRTISVRPCFSKTLERLMYNRLCKYSKVWKNFIQNNSFSKRAIQLIMHYCNLLTKFTDILSEYTIVDFIDLSEAFETVNHNIMLKKIEIYGISWRYNTKLYCHGIKYQTRSNRSNILLVNI